MIKTKTYLTILGFALVLASCTEGESPNEIKQEDPPVEMLNVDDISAGPVLHKTLTPEQLEKVDFLYETFKEVDETPKSQWIEDFKRDDDPDDEIGVWMEMASAYNLWTFDKDLSIPVKEEAYKVILYRSMYAPEDVLEEMELEFLTGDEAIEIMNGYTREPDPIEVIEAP